MRKAVNGDGRAMERLYRLTATALFNYLRRLGGNRTDADDVLQTTFLNAWRSRTRFRGDGARAWLFTIARNAFYSHIARQDAGTQISSNPLSPATPSEQFVATDLSRRIEAALDRLPDDTREVVVLSRVSGLSIREIAQLTALSEGNVRTRIHRGLTKLKQVLD